jgi:bacillopeptidase F (M6 metalloprotease family)
VYVIYFLIYFKIRIMKRKLSILSITAILLAFTAFMVSCNSKPKVVNDSLVLSATDTTGLADFQAWKAINERKDASQYFMQASQPVNNTVATAPRKATTARKTSAATTTQPVAAKKKGWSKAAKGTAIGAATGAIAGAIINKKNRVLGGVIGGVLGGGVGYGIGRGMDKKDGRY